MIKISNGLDSFLDSTGKLLETVPKIYDDVIQPTAIETGKTLSIIPKTINAALVPLRQWISNKEYNLAETEKLITHKLENISPDKIVSPDAYVAVPAIQAISYSMDNNELRNLYANLIAKSMNTDTKDTVHPAFVEIIKQLSPFDATLFKKLTDMNRKSFGIATIRIQKSELESEGSDLIDNIINPQFGMNLDNLNKYQLSLANLQRLELIYIGYDTYLIDTSEYESIENSDIVTYCKNKASSIHEKYSFFKFKKGTLRITELGTAFGNTCIKE